MKRTEIVKDLRARGWAGEITKAVVIEHGYTPNGEVDEWETPEPGPKPAASVAPPKKPDVIIPAAVKPAQ